MASEDAKRKLVDFLDREAFLPVLKANPTDYSEGQRDKVQDVKRATKSERDRFHGYDSAEEVYKMFKDDLNSEPAKRIHKALRELGLPTLNDVQSDFERLAHDVGVA